MLGTVSGTPSVPTVTDNLLSQGIIQTETIGISYVPSTSASNVANGELTFGGTDSTKYVCLLDSDIFFLMKRQIYEFDQLRSHNPNVTSKQLLGYRSGGDLRDINTDFEYNRWNRRHWHHLAPHRY